MKKLVSALVATSALLGTVSATADTFNAGSIIIPMDTDYQDMGMLRAYGLVYELLRQGVPVRWVIATGKQVGDADFVADTVDIQSANAIASHGYRGGPFVVDSVDAATAMPIIAAWQILFPETAAHSATTAFDGEVAKRLVAAPKVAMFADGNQKIARGYLQAAGIPDSTLDPDWPDTSPDMLTVSSVSGPTTTEHNDGALFDGDGDPAYCQFMSMHWGVNDAADNLEVVEEVREFLNHPTHFYAQCQAVNAFENHGHYLTTDGFDVEGKPNEVTNLQPDSPFAQLDGPFGTTGGSEPAFSLAPGSTFQAGGVTLLAALGAQPGTHDVWMTGWLNGNCASGEDTCFAFGKVSYVGGHEYDTDTPISANPGTRGTRMFLNSLFDSNCATAAGAPSLYVNANAPASVAVPEITLTIGYQNSAGAVALNAKIRNALPAGTSFVSAGQGGTHDSGVVTWDLGNLGVGESGALTLTVSLPQEDTYANEAELTYEVGLTAFTLSSNQTSTVYTTSGGQGGAGGSGTGGAGEGGSDTGGDDGGGNMGGAGSSSGQGPMGGSTPGGGSGGSASNNGIDADSDRDAEGAGSVDTGGCACTAAGRSEDADAPWMLALLLSLGLVGRGLRTNARSAIGSS